MSSQPGSLPQWSLPGPAGDDDAEVPQVDTRSFEDRYERRELLGVGGMGRVTLARDRKLERLVALKELRTDLAPGRDPGGPDSALAPGWDARRSDPRTLRARLMREARLTARLDHPGVVSVFDVGEREDGTLFYTMRVVRGQSLATALGSAPRDARGRLERGARDRLLRAILAACDAVGFAHRLGVVHRDLKPGNIMVGEFGETQVVDWGLAIEVHTQVSRDEARTRDAGVGTPGYMSPEQERGGIIDARSDVWSLGAVLREVLVGARPGATRPSGGRPLAGHENTIDGVERELLAIVDRAVSIEAERRYPDAKALAEDLENYLDGRLVTAHEYTPWQLLRRLLRAWRGPLIALGAVLVAVGVTVGLGYADTERERQRAVDAEGEALGAAQAARQAEVATGLALAESRRSLASMLTTQAEQRHREGARPEAELLAAQALTFGPSPEATGILMANDAAPRPVLVDELALPPCPEVVPAPREEAVLCRDAEGLALWDLRPLRRRWHVALRTVRDPVFLADGTVVASTPNTIVALDPVLGTQRFEHPRAFTTPRAQSDGGAVTVLAGPNAFHVVGAAGCRGFKSLCDNQWPVLATAHDTRVGAEWLTLCGDGRLFEGLVPEAAEPEAHPTFAARIAEGVATGLAAPAAMAALPGPGQGAGGDVIVLRHNGEVARVDRGGRLRYRRESGLQPIREVVVSPEGRLAVVRGERAGVALLDVATGAWLGRLPASMNRAVRFVGPRELVTIGTTWRRWRLPEPHPTVLPADGGVTTLEARAEGDGWVVTLGADDALERWRWPLPKEGAHLGPIGWHGLTVKSLALGKDGEALAVSSGALGVWRLPAGEAASERDLEAFGDTRARRIGRLDDAAGGSWWLLLDYDNAVLALRFEGGVSETPILGAEGPLREHHDLAVAPGHRAAAILSQADGRARRLIASARGVEADREVEVGSATAIALERDGETFWIAGGERLERWDFTRGTIVASARVPEAELVEVAVSDLTPEGEVWVAVGGLSGEIWLWRAGPRDALNLVAHFEDHTERIAALAFAGEALLLSGGWDDQVRVRALRPVPTAAALEAAWGLGPEAVLRR